MDTSATEPPLTEKGTTRRPPPPNPRPGKEGTGAAHEALEILLCGVHPGVQYRLWDGNQRSIGTPDGSFTLIVRDPSTFRQSFSSLNTKAIAEAYIDNRIEVEGDLFACVRAANQLEGRRIRWRDKYALWRLLRQVKP